jgi:hypothetical protein
MESDGILKDKFLGYVDDAMLNVKNQLGAPFRAG